MSASVIASSFNSSDTSTFQHSVANMRFKNLQSSLGPALSHGRSSGGPFGAATCAFEGHSLGLNAAQPCSEPVAEEGHGAKHCAWSMALGALHLGQSVALGALQSSHRTRAMKTVWRLEGDVEARGRCGYSKHGGCGGSKHGGYEGFRVM